MFVWPGPAFSRLTATIGARINDDPQIVVQGADLERIFVNGVDRVANLAARLGLQGPAALTAALEGIEGVLNPSAAGGHRRKAHPPAGRAIGNCRVQRFRRANWGPARG